MAHATNLQRFRSWDDYWEWALEVADGPHSAVVDLKTNRTWIITPVKCTALTQNNPPRASYFPQAAART